MLDQKKGQISPGLVTGIIFGIATLVIGIIIAFTITSTLSGADLLTSTRSSVAVANETNAFVNSTTYTLDGVSDNPNYVPGSFAISLIENATNGAVLTAANYTVSDDGVVENASVTEWINVSIVYGYTVKSSEELTSTGLTTNFTEGVNNVSSKIPTVLLIAAIVLIIGVLGILVAVWQRMKFGGSTL